MTQWILALSDVFRDQQARRLSRYYATGLPKGWVRSMVGCCAARIGPPRVSRSIRPCHAIASHERRWHGRQGSGSGSQTNRRRGGNGERPAMCPGLSAKLLLLTILFVMLAEVLIFVPSVANFRQQWLIDRLTAAQLAALAAEAAPGGQLPDHAARRAARARPRCGDRAQARTSVARAASSRWTCRPTSTPPTTSATPPGLR